MTRLFAAEVELAGASRSIGLAHAPSLVLGLAALPGTVDWAGVIVVATLA